MKFPHVGSKLLQSFMKGIVLEVTYQSVSLKASSKTRKATAIKYTARAGKYGWGGNPSSRVQGK